MTRVISEGSSLGVTDALVTPYAFCNSRMPKAAGSKVTASLCCTAPAMPQQSRPRARTVPIKMNFRPCLTRSSIGPMNGASKANGAIVMIRASATLPLAWVGDALKKRVAGQRDRHEAVSDAPGGRQFNQLSQPRPGWHQTRR